MDQYRPTPRPSRLLGPLLGAGLLGGLALPPAAGATSWQAIDQLRQVLQRAGVPVVQRDCGSRGLQGLYHPSSDTIVVCRVHRDPAAVWNTLAHEATHRMQACRGGAITDPRHHRAMAAALARRSPQDLASLKMYPPQERIGELEARYTAQLPPAQVIQLFERYCGGGGRGRSYARLS
ncbi:MAG: hypothetical protein ACKO5F_14375 [Synechococcus sp.]